MTRALALAFLALSACGGKVVFVEDDGAGGGSSSSSPSSAAGTEKFEPGPEPDPRGDVCAALCPPACQDDVQGCVDDCLDDYFGLGCDTPALALLTCKEAGLDVSTCTVGACLDEGYAFYDECPMGWCSEGCTHADQSCSCLRNCNDRALQMDCTMVADAEASCDCKVDGALVSTCTETHVACDLDFGCCATAFGF